jgi:hypothetical protein
MNQQLFDAWLGEMNMAIARFVESAPPEIRSHLDGSDESLNVVEQWLLRKYANPKEACAESETLFIDGAARYLGEIFRLRSGSTWGIELSNPKDAFYGIPSLRGGSLRTNLCPLTTVTASTDRRNGLYFATILGNIRQDKAAVR